MFEEKTITKTTEYHGRVIDVETHTVSLVNGQQAYREILRHNGGACMVAVDGEDNIYMVRQYRKAIEKMTTEIPAGKLEKGEDPRECAIRELREETGLVPGKVEDLGFIYTTPGFCDEKLYFFLATELIQKSMQPDPGELVDCIKMNIYDCLEMIFSGQISDSKTIAAVLRASNKLGYIKTVV